MGKLNILHLSDLHLTFSNSDISQADFKRIKQELINTIKQIKVEKGIDIVAVTGDIINRGCVQNFDRAKDFFLEIAQQTEVEHYKFLFVPGNHDAKRDKPLENLSLDMIDDYDSFKSHYIGRYEKFCDFYKNVTQDDAIGSRSFGVKDFNINGVIVRMILLNSAICSTGEKDFMNLYVSSYQLEKISNLIDENKKPAITIALMHHPLQWLNLDDQKTLLEYFENEFKVNLLLHGHTHEGRIYGSMDLDTTLLNFVTGIAYEDKSKRTGLQYKKIGYRIAFYSLDLEHNKIDGKLFVTNEKYKFVPDMTRYRRINNNGSFSLSYPLTSTNDFQMYEDSQNAMLKQMVEEKTELKNRIDELETMIYSGKKYRANSATITFDIKNKIYKMKFKKTYELILDDVSWYSGQFYGNKYPDDPVASRNFYDKNPIKWEDLKFKAYATIKDNNIKTKTRRTELIVDCVAESSNYKTFNIRYISKSTKANLDLQKGDTIELEYQYEVPISHWGTYINRTISCFNETGTITVCCDDEAILQKSGLVLCKEPNTELKTMDDFNVDDKKIIIDLPSKSGKYILHWNAKEIFGIQESNTPMVKDLCQITNT